MDARQIRSKGFLVWYVVASLVVVIALAWAMEGQVWWKVLPVLAAYVSLVWGAGCAFCKRAREALQNPVEHTAEQLTPRPKIST